MLLLLRLLANLLFGVACLPTAYLAIKEGCNPGVPVSTAWLLWCALVCYTSWQFLEFGFHLPFCVGPVEIVSWAVVIFYHYFPRWRPFHAVH